MLNLFCTAAEGLPPEGLLLARALADVATIGFLQERSITAGAVLAEQLQTALNRRVGLEQAKGVLAERGQLGMGEPFHALRSYARRHGLRLVVVAEQVIEGSLDVLAVTTSAAVPTRTAPA